MTVYVCACMCVCARAWVFVLNADLPPPNTCKCCSEPIWLLPRFFEQHFFFRGKLSQNSGAAAVMRGREQRPTQRLPWQGNWEGEECFQTEGAPSHLQRKRRPAALVPTLLPQQGEKKVDGAVCGGNMAGVRAHKWKVVFLGYPAKCCETREVPLHSKSPIGLHSCSIQMVRPSQLQDVRVQAKQGVV